MFGMLTDTIENALDVADSLFSGEDISKKQISKLISDGLEIAAIAAITGVAVDTIKDLFDDNN